MQKLATRDNILAIQDKISSLPGAMFGDCFPLKHSIVDGLYIREIFVPAGNLIVTKLFKQAHATFVLLGEVSILTEEGLKRIKAPCHMITNVGTKRVIYTHQDTVWVTVHPNPKNLRNLEQLEEDIIAKNYQELDSLEKAFINVFTEAK